MFNFFMLILSISKCVLEQKVHVFGRREETGKQLVQSFILQSLLLCQEGIGRDQRRGDIASLVTVSQILL